MLKGNMYFSPFLGDNKTLSVGLNPLGFRTASEQLFTTLLPGLNVVTLRIRYYSFYCWLLQSFFKNRKEAKRADLQRYIRMSELLMALIHAQSDNNLGIPGITRALEIVKEGKDTIDFNEDAMPNGKPVGGYWKGSFGAFGTYYAPSLQEIGLILPLFDDSRLYNITPQKEGMISGESLADAFAESIGKENEKIFENCVLSGIVTRRELAQMEPRFQSHNLPDNTESHLLLQTLIQSDKPLSIKDSYLRKNTLRLLLEYYRDYPSDSFSELQFANYVYNKFSEGSDKSLAAAGWYAYYLNDIRQYEALVIFNELLKRLLESTSPGRWESIDGLTTELAEEVCSHLCVKDMALEEMMSKWDSINEPIDKMSHAFYITFDNYVKNPNYKEAMAVVRSFFYGVNNDALDEYDRMRQSLNLSVRDYIKHYLTEKIIYNHYSESMRKFSQNGVPTQKLTIENGYVRGIGTYDATHSSPRIGSLRNYATDLGLIKDSSITHKGVELLKILQNDRA